MHWGLVMKIWNGLQIVLMGTVLAGFFSSAIFTGESGIVEAIWLVKC